MNCPMCVPEVERCDSEPFVYAYNYANGREFQYRSTPDLEDREAKRPDGLYMELGTGSSLAIERKRLEYPADSIAGHRKAHLIIDHLSANLPEAISAGPYVLSMPFNYKDKKIDVMGFAKEMCSYIEQNLTTILNEGCFVFESDGPCRGLYELSRKDHCPLFHQEGAPWERIVFSMYGPESIRFFNWERAQGSELPTRIHRLLNKASQQLNYYEDSTKVLLLRRVGEIRGPVSEPYIELASELARDTIIDEIWDGRIETPDYCEPYWVYTRLWSRSPFDAPGREVCCEVGCFCRTSKH